MFVSICVYVIVCLWGIRFCFGYEGNRQYLSVEHTLSIKGIFILLVFFSHLQGYVTFTDWKDLFCVNIIGSIGQGMVTMFLFYSGYGVMESIRKKGEAYVRAMPVKRILSTWFRFACAVTLFVPVALWHRESLTLSRIAWSMIGWEAVGNSNWYIFAVLILYLITYIAFRLAGVKQNLLSIALVLLGTAVYIFTLSFGGIKETWWYDTVLCYSFGMVWSLFVGTTGEKLLNKRVSWGIAMVTLLVAFYCLNEGEFSVINQIIRNLFFAAVVVLLTMRISVGNTILRWCGKHLFPLYILQRIPMIIFKDLGISQISIELFIVLCLISTVAMVYPFEQVTDLLWKKIEPCFKT